MLLAYLGGEGAGEAIWHILSGKVSPSGKLAETWPIHMMDVPSFGFYPGFADFSLYKESIFVGYRYYLTADKKVRFPFGHGLSYAKFKQDIKLSKKVVGEGDTLTVEVDVTNLSSMAVEKVIQIYIEPKESNIFRAKRTLAGFVKVALKGKEHRVVSIQLDHDTFSFYDRDTDAFAVEKGIYLIELAESSEEIISAVEVRVEGEEFQDLQVALPVYYKPSQESFLMNDESFETLLGHSFPSIVDHRSRPFNLNSTLDDISWTWVGKRIYKQFEKMSNIDINDPKNKNIVEPFRGTPIRNLGMGGGPFANPRVIYAILSLANRRPLQAFFRLITGLYGRNK